MHKVKALVARRYVHEATHRLPVIGDADTGYGNAVNVKRTLRGFAAAGFAGILIEDQVCWHVARSHYQYNIERENVCLRFLFWL